jgi:hypothetical protein
VIEVCFLVCRNPPQRLSRTVKITTRLCVISSPAHSQFGPPLQLVIVQRESATASGKDQHPGADQFIADVSGPTAYQGPGNDPSDLGKDVVTAVGELAQLLDGFVEVAPFGGRIAWRCRGGRC